MLQNYMEANGYLNFNVNDFSFADIEQKDAKAETERQKALNTISKATSSNLLPAYNDTLTMDELIKDTAKYGSMNIPHPMHLLRALTSDFNYFEKKYGILDAFTMLTLQMAYVFRLNDVITHEWRSDKGLSAYYEHADAFLTDENEAIALLQCHTLLEVETWFNSLYIKYGVADVNSLSANEVAMSDLSNLATQCCARVAIPEWKIDFTTSLFNDEYLTQAVQEFETGGIISVDVFCDIIAVDDEHTIDIEETPEEWVARIKRTLRNEVTEEHTWEDVDTAVAEFGIPTRDVWNDYMKQYEINEIMSNPQMFAIEWYLDAVQLESQVVNQHGLTEEFKNAMAKEDFVKQHFEEGDVEKLLLTLNELTPVVFKYKEQLGDILPKAFNEFESILETIKYGSTVKVPEITTEDIKAIEAKSKIFYLLKDLEELVKDVKPLDLQMAKPIAKGEAMIAPYTPQCKPELFEKIVEVTGSLFKVLDDNGVSTALAVARDKKLVRLGFFLGKLIMDKDFQPIARDVVFDEEEQAEPVNENELNESPAEEEVQEVDETEEKVMTKLEKQLDRIEKKLDMILDTYATKDDVGEAVLTLSELLGNQPKKEEKKEETGYLDEEVEEAISISKGDFLKELSGVKLVKQHSSVKIKRDESLTTPREIVELCEEHNITLPKCARGNVIVGNLFVTPVLLKGSKDGVEKAVNYTGVVYCNGIYVLYVNSYSVLFSIDDGGVYSITDLEGSTGLLHFNCNRYPNEHSMFEHYSNVKTFTAIVTGTVLSPKEFIDRCNSVDYRPSSTIEVMNITDTERADAVRSVSKLENSNSLHTGREFIAPSVPSDFDIPQELHIIGKKVGVRENTVAVSNFADDTYLARISATKDTWLTGYARGEGVTMIVKDGYILAIKQDDGGDVITTADYALSVGKAVIGSKSFTGTDALVGFIAEVRKVHKIKGEPITATEVAKALIYEEPRMDDVAPDKDTIEVEEPQFKTPKEVESVEEYEKNVKFIEMYEDGSMPCSAESAKPFYDKIQAYEEVNGKPVKEVVAVPNKAKLPATLEVVENKPELLTDFKFTNPKDDPQFEQKLALGFYTAEDVSAGDNPLGNMFAPEPVADNQAILQKLANLVKPEKTQEELLLEELAKVMGQGQTPNPLAALNANLNVQNDVEAQAAKLLQAMTAQSLTPEQQLMALIQQAQPAVATPLSAQMR